MEVVPAAGWSIRRKLLASAFVLAHWGFVGVWLMPVSALKTWVIFIR